MSEEHELAAIAAELERYWSEQWRRAREICDLLEQRLASRTKAGPQLHLVAAPESDREPDDGKPTRPPLKLVDA